MKVCGLTGGVGMGKSAAGQALQRRGVPVVDTDVLARQIVEPGQPALREIEQTFGRDIIGPDGRLRRDELGRIVFSNPAARRQLEGLTHPRIRELWRSQIETWRQERNASVAVVVIPLLFEIGAEAEVDATICVACSAGAQWQRLSERRWSAGQIRQRIGAQWPVEKKMAKADYVVWAEGPLPVLAEQINRILDLS
jgi:dephospho-CoA kinase